MDVKIKAVLVLLPFGIATYVGMSMLQPAMDDANAKDATLSTKQGECESLKNKTKGSAVISQREVELKQQIEKLRDSVPKSPDTDLLTIDLEKMCKDAGMNMIGLTAAKSGGSSAPARSSEDAAKSSRDKLKNMLKGGAAANTAPSAAAPAGGGELESSSKTFTVTGDYEGLQKLVHELETYQRVVKIDDLDFHITEKVTATKDKAIKIEDSSPAEGSEGGDPRLMFITMTLTTYFLP